MVNLVATLYSSYRRRNIGTEPYSYSIRTRDYRSMLTCWRFLGVGLITDYRRIA